MDNLKSFQIDLSEDELCLIERLGSLAGLRTKKDVLLNGVTLLRWACTEILYGRTICSVDDRNGNIKHVELPVLTSVAEKIKPDPTFTNSTPVSGKRFSEFAPRDITEEASHGDGPETIGEKELGAG